MEREEKRAGLQGEYKEVICIDAGCGLMLYCVCVYVCVYFVVQSFGWDWLFQLSFLLILLFHEASHRLGG